MMMKMMIVMMMMMRRRWEREEKVLSAPCTLSVHTLLRLPLRN